MLTLIKGAQLFAPESLGKQDVLLAGNTISTIAENIELTAENVNIEVVDGHDCYLFPGLVDSLVHVTGGGGEGGFTTRTPQMHLSDATSAGITTVVGALGTDSVTRTLPDLLAKTKSLNEEGISCFCYTGSYQIPAKTMLNSITEDIMLFEECIGVGEVAIADHRSSQPSVEELAKLAAEARVGGMLSGKSGIVSVHCGDGESRLDLLHQVIEQTDIPASQFYPTHINRHFDLLKAGVSFAKAGGNIDLTTSTTAHALAHGEVKCSKGLKYLLENDTPKENITFSSDGHASLPDFDSEGKLIQLLVGDEQSLFNELRDSVLDENISIPEALSVVTKNPARILGLKKKGEVKEGLDADVILVKKADFTIDTVIAKGQIMVRNGRSLVKGRFE